MKTLLKRIHCTIFGHDAEGPDTHTAFEIEPGRWHPFYHCRRCKRSLKWNLDTGGFDA